MSDCFFDLAPAERNLAMPAARQARAETETVAEIIAEY
jgi:hypothetical protein